MAGRCSESWLRSVWPWVCVSCGCWAPSPAPAPAKNRERRSRRRCRRDNGAGGQRPDDECAGGERAGERLLERPKRFDGERADRQRAAGTANGLQPGHPLAQQLLSTSSPARSPAADLTLTRAGRTTRSPVAWGSRPVGRRGGSCDGCCQRWVSACVLARVDSLGSTEISERGAQPGAAPTWRSFRVYAARGDLLRQHLHRRPAHVRLPPAGQGRDSACLRRLARQLPHDGGGFVCEGLRLPGACLGGFVNCSTSGKRAGPELSRKRDGLSAEVAHVIEEPFPAGSSSALAGSGGMGAVYRARDLTDGASSPSRS